MKQALKQMISALACAAALWAAGGTAWATSNIPDYYEEPGFSPFRVSDGDQVAEGDHSVDEVIDPFGGGLQLQYTDMVIPGNGGLDIIVRRTYRNLAGQPGGFRQ